FNVVLDLILIRFLQRYGQRPLHFFGRLGLWAFGLSVLCFLAMLYFKYIFPWPPLFWSLEEESKSFVETPLPSLTVMFFLAGVVSILLGIQSELIMRTYYEAQGKTTYLLGEIRQGTPPDQRDGYDLRLMCSVKDARDIPSGGKDLIIVAAMDQVLYF